MEILMNELKVRKLLMQLLNLNSLDMIESTDDLRIVGLDSLNCIELVIEIEKAFQIVIPDEKLGIRYMHSIYDICKLIEEVINDEQLQTISI